MTVKIYNIVVKLGKQAEGRIYVQAFHGKTRTKYKPITTGKQTTITLNNSQRTKETLELYIQLQL